MREEPELRAFGDLEAAADAFEQLPLMVVVTDGNDLRTAAFNAAARASVDDRPFFGLPILEAFSTELLGQGWAEAYATPTRTGETITMPESRIQLEQRDGSVVEMYIDAVFAPRLDADGRPRGTILVCRDVTERVKSRAVLEREVEELQERYSAARGSVRSLQRALLPDTVPVLPGFDLAARYVLASDEAAAGGDWFDAVARPDGSVVLVVGDVVGHGPAAAVAMGQLRSVLLAHLRAGSGLEDAVRFLDGFAATVPAARRATVCLVAVDADGDVEYCTAGHPPPLLLTDGEAESRYLPPSGGGPLATGSDFHLARTHLAPGEVVVLYTDGILERPGVSPAAATTQLRATASGARQNLLMPSGASPSAAERICSLTIELLTRSTGHTDDITLLAAQRRPVTPPLDVELEVGPDAARQARWALRGWLAALDPVADDVTTLLHTVTELAANVVDHAHLGGEARPFRLRARLEPTGQAVVEVADRGSWKRPLVTGGRGRGLALVRQVVDQLDLDRGPGGTTATVRHALRRSAGLLDRGAPQDTTDPEHFDVFARGGSRPSVTVVGPLDGATSAETAAYLQLAVTEADEAVLLDLAGTTLLASSGVDLLFRVADHARTVGVELDVVAPNGSPAQQVLELVRLPYHLLDPRPS